MHIVARNAVYTLLALAAAATVGCAGTHGHATKHAQLELQSAAAERVHYRVGVADVPEQSAGAAIAAGGEQHAITINDCERDVDARWSGGAQGAVNSGCPQPR